MFKLTGASSWTWICPRSHLPLLLFLVLLHSACSANRFDRPESGSVQRGIASWYGEPFHGRPTASGEIYDMHGLSAAHRDLPLGTRVEVKNLENGRTVALVINDRGPFVRGRVLDLSYGAAQELDTVRAGLVKVEIRVLEVGAGRPGPKLASAYTLQVGAFRDYKTALELEQSLASEYPDVSIVTNDSWHRVQIGRFKSEADARTHLKGLRKKGLQVLIVPLS